MRLRGAMAAALLMLAAGYAFAHQHSGVAMPPLKPQGDARPKLSSTTLCGDLWIMALADQDQIVSVSQNATGVHSPYADLARKLPQNRGSLEELIAGDAKLVVTGHGSSPQLRRMLSRFAMKELDLPMSSDFDTLAQKIAATGAEFGQPARGEILRDAFTQRIAGTRPALTPGNGPVVAYYRPDGGGAGADTFVDAAIAAAGYVNLQREVGPAGWRGIPLEEIVMNPPDAFVVSYFDDQKPSLKAGLGRNPVLQKAAEGGLILAVPGKFWPCDDPVIAEAVTVLAAAREAIESPGS